LKLLGVTPLVSSPSRIHICRTFKGDIKILL